MSYVSAFDGDMQMLDSTAAAKAVGLLFSAANELAFALLMRLIVEGDATAAARIARCIVEGKGAVIEPGQLSEVLVQVQRRPKMEVQCLRGASTRTGGGLSQRELSILRLMSQGLSNRQIAETSSRSLHTVDAQVKKIYRKLEVRSRAQAVSNAMQKGILD